MIFSGAPFSDLTFSDLPPDAGGGFSGTLVPGSKTLNGQTLTLAFQRNFTLVPGGLVKNGQVLTLTIASGGSYTGTLVPGTIVKNGQQLTLSRYAGTLVAGTINKSGGVLNISVPSAFKGGGSPKVRKEIYRHEDGRLIEIGKGELGAMEAYRKEPGRLVELRESVNVDKSPAIAELVRQQQAAVRKQRQDDEQFERDVQDAMTWLIENLDED